MIDLSGIFPNAKKSPGSQDSLYQHCNPYLLMGRAIIIMLVLLLIVGCSIEAPDQTTEVDVTPESAKVESPTSTALASSTPVLTPEPTLETSVDAEPDSIETGSNQADIISDQATPEMGPIVFAQNITDEFEPIDSAASFAGDTTELHAIFEYNNLSRNATWKRVLYLDGLEVISSEETWEDDESGVYDYVFGGGGNPLPDGEWVLELYVGDDLMSSNTFIVEPTAEVVAIAPTATPTAIPVIPTATPFLTPTPSPPPPPPPSNNCPSPDSTNITSPVNGQTIRGVVPFMGTAYLDNLVYYKFEYKPADSPTWQFLTQFDYAWVTNDKLMDFYTSTIAPGVYDFRLIVVDKSGNYPPPCEIRLTVRR